MSHKCQLEGSGSTEVDYMIVGIAPGKREVREGTPFVGDSGQLLDAVIKSIGLKRSDFFVTNTICWWKNEPNEIDLDFCAERLNREIHTVKPKVIFPLGKVPTERLTGLPYSKSRHLAIWSHKYECWIIGSWHPAAALRSQIDDMVADLQRDLKKHKLYNGKVPADFEVSHTVIKDPHDAAKYLNELPLNTPISMDVETYKNDDDDFYDRMSCFAVCTGGTATAVITDEAFDFGDYVDWNHIKNLQLVFHNGIYDIQSFYRNFGVWLPVVEDTLLASFALDTRSGGDDDNDTSKMKQSYHGLKKLAAEYEGAGAYAENVDLKTASGETLWEYNAKDAAYTARLYNKFYDMMRDDNVYTMYKTLMVPAANVLAEAQHNGAYIDKRFLALLAHEWGTRYMELEDELHEMANSYGWDGKQDINLNSPKQLNRFLYEICQIPYTEHGSTTKRDALELMDHPFVAQFLEYRRVDRMMTHYVIGIEKSIQRDNRVHPSPQLHGTRTGRLTYHNPPVQTIPKDFKVGEEYGKIRAMFAAPEGYTLFAADYEQAEIWTLYFYSGDENLLADLMTGDFHGQATEAMFRIKKSDTDPHEWGKKRDQSKYVTFGIAYGRGAKALHKAELNEYTLEECVNFVNQWRERYWKVSAWSDAQKKQIRKEGEQITISGRKFRYPTVLNYSNYQQAINYPIQSGSHDILLAGMNELNAPLKELGGEIWFDVHDALIGVIPTNVQDEAIKLLKDVMERPRFGLDRGIPLEIKIGKNWRDARKI